MNTSHNQHHHHGRDQHHEHNQEHHHHQHNKPGQHDHNPPGLPNLPFRGFWKLSNVISTGLLAASWIYPLHFWKQIAETVPMQYSLTGAINWVGSKKLIFLLPLGATIAYLRPLVQKISPERELFPLSSSQNNPRKMEYVAKTLRSLLGVITQAAVLAGSILFVKGPTVSQVTRASWIRTGLAVAGVLVALSYGEASYLLNFEGC